MSQCLIVVETNFFFLPNVGKVFEKTINSRLRQFLYKYDVTTACRHGFRNEKSKIDAILELSEQVVKIYWLRVYADRS